MTSWIEMIYLHYRYDETNHCDEYKFDIILRGERFLNNPLNIFILFCLLIGS